MPIHLNYSVCIQFHIWLLKTWTTSWKLIRCLGSCSGSKPPQILTCEMSRSHAVWKSHICHKDTPTSYIWLLNTDHSQSTPRYLCKPLAATKALHGKHQLRQSRPGPIFVGPIPIKSWSVPQPWINKHLQRDGLTNIEHEISETVKLAQGGHNPAAWTQTTPQMPSSWLRPIISRTETTNPFILDT